MLKRSLLFITLILILVACASRMRDQMKAYRDLFALGDFKKAEEALEKSELKKDQKSVLLYHLEKGTLELNQGKYNEAILHFQESLSLIDALYTKKLTAKAASLLINDASDEFYGASYERSYAHYFLAKAYYLRYLTSQNKLDLQGARATILAWDTYFAELQRNADSSTVYKTDLMLKVFGGEVHEVSEIRNDKQIALQLYKDALKILDTLGGVYSVFNSKNADYVKAVEAALKGEKNPSADLYAKTPSYTDLRDFLHYKILLLTKQLRSNELSKITKELKPSEAVSKKLKAGEGNVVLVLEEGLIPPKIGKPFNFGIRGAMNAVSDNKTKQMIATAGVDFITTFAMNKLDMVPTEKTNPGTFLFGATVTRLGVQEAAIEFELPMIENVPIVQRLEVFVLDDRGVIIHHGPLPIVTENGDLARVVLEEDAVSRYVKTGTRIAMKHIVAILAAIGVYKKLKQGRDDGGDFFAKTAAVATYVGASKGLQMLERADTRHWTTLPQAIRLTELKLPPGTYKIGVGTYSGTKAPDAPSKLLSDIVVKNSEKSLYPLSFSLTP
jgi:hypothetical protein